ncbi:MAG: 50S ribosomal protein L24e, partial [Candidatus Altiarchaeota archaeon]|nr:50S ribosomal protein L24e [Candidatus Altiarchaeota archaeon]
MDCIFCGHEIPKGTGNIYVTKKGKALYFCSSKCKKNQFKLKRKPRRVRWTDEYLAEKAIRVKSTPAPKKVVKEEKAKKKPVKKKVKEEKAKKKPVKKKVKEEKAKKKP